MPARANPAGWEQKRALKRFFKKLLARPGRGKSDAGADGLSAQAVVADGAPCVADNRRVYCIGDIHGRLDLLEELHTMINVDADGFDGSKVIVYLGDYIDRGAQSAQVLDLLVGESPAGFETVYLKGNHEQSMLDFLRDPYSTAAWLIYGGRVTMLSYGIAPGKIMRMEALEQLRDELVERVPQKHIDFMRACQLLHTEGDYCFVHAGIRPQVPLEMQMDNDLMWIREEFTHSKVQHGHVVVHGHTIAEEVEWLPNRIGIDTGAYQSGLLTALVLQGQEQRLLQTGRTV